MVPSTDSSYQISLERLVVQQDRILKLLTAMLEAHDCLSERLDWVERYAGLADGGASIAAGNIKATIIPFPAPKVSDVTSVYTL